MNHLGSPSTPESNENVTNNISKLSEYDALVQQFAEKKYDLQTLSSLSNALETLEEGGLQVILEKYGPEKFFDAVILAKEGVSKRDVHLLDIVTALEPDKKKRNALYAEMEQTGEHSISFTAKQMQGMDGLWNKVRKGNTSAGRSFAAPIGARTLAELPIAVLNKAKQELSNSSVIQYVEALRDEVDDGMSELREWKDGHGMEIEQKIKHITEEEEGAATKIMQSLMSDLESLNTVAMNSTTGAEGRMQLAVSLEQQMNATIEQTKKMIEERTAPLRQIMEVMEGITERY